MRNKNNSNWTKKGIAKQYKYENPNWTWNTCYAKAKIIYKELNKLNNETWENSKRFFKMNTPFSFFDNKDGEFSDIPWNGKWE